MGCWQMSELGASVLPFPPSPLAREKTKTRERGVFYFFDTLSVTLVVSGPPFGSLVCLRKCHDDVVLTVRQQTAQSDTNLLLQSKLQLHEFLANEPFF
jgi:hypothetical protein